MNEFPVFFDGDVTTSSQVLVFIWTKILALDRSCQIDLVKDNGHNYFMNVLASNKVPTNQRTMAAFVLSVIMYEQSLSTFRMPFL